MIIHNPNAWRTGQSLIAWNLTTAFTESLPTLKNITLQNSDDIVSNNIAYNTNKLWAAFFAESAVTGAMPNQVMYDKVRMVASETRMFLNSRSDTMSGVIHAINAQ